MFSNVIFGSAVLILLSAKFSQSVYTIPKISVTIPEVLVEPLEPRGLRMSIPDEEGISQVTYHILTKYKLSTGGFETRETSAEVSHTTNGRWVFNDRSIRLNKDDIVEYFLTVVQYGVEYESDSRQYTVTGTNDEIQLIPSSERPSVVVQE